MENRFSVTLESDLQDVLDEFVKFRIKYCELESKCQSIREEYRADVADIHQTNADQINRMEEEIEILRSQIAGQEELHREEIRRIECRNEREAMNYRRTIDALKTQINDLKASLARTATFNVHPALHKSTPKYQSKPRKTTASFNWPSLNIEIMETSTDKSTDAANVKSKKNRKLYTPDDEVFVDLTSQK